MKEMKIVVLMIIPVIAVIIAGCTWLNNYDGNKPTSQVASPKTAQSAANSGAVPSETGVTAGQAINWAANIYYPDNQAMYLQKTQKTFRIPSDATLEYKVKTCFDELKNAPYAAIPKNTSVISAVLKQDILELNLSGEFESDMNAGSATLNMAFGQIVLTLTDLPGVKQIMFLIDSKTVVEFKGQIELNKAFLRDEYEQFISK